MRINATMPIYQPFKNTVGVVQKHKQPTADAETFTTESQTARLDVPIYTRVMLKRYPSQRTKQSRTARAVVKTNTLMFSDKKTVGLCLGGAVLETVVSRNCSFISQRHTKTWFKKEVWGGVSKTPKK